MTNNLLLWQFWTNKFRDFQMNQIEENETYFNCSVSFHSSNLVEIEHSTA